MKVACCVAYALQNLNPIKYLNVHLRMLKVKQSHIKEYFPLLFWRIT